VCDTSLTARLDRQVTGTRPNAERTDADACWGCRGTPTTGPNRGWVGGGAHGDVGTAFHRVDEGSGRETRYTQRCSRPAKWGALPPRWY